MRYLFICELRHQSSDIFFVFAVISILCVLDCHMDGQLGNGGNNSMVPCLVEHFLELGGTDSLTNESGEQSKESLKVFMRIFLVPIIFEVPG